MSQLPDDLKKQELASLTNILSKDKQTNNNNNSLPENNVGSKQNGTKTASTSNKPTGQEINLWNKILEESSKNVRSRIEPRHLIILGNHYSGKSSLLARLQNMNANEIREGIALDYAFINIEDQISKTTDEGKFCLKVVDHFEKFSPFF